MRAVIAEDLALLRDGLVRVLLAHGIEVVEAVKDGPSVVDALLAHRPDVAVLDVRLPPTFTNEGLVAAIERLLAPRYECALTDRAERLANLDGKDLGLAEDCVEFR